MITLQPIIKDNWRQAINLSVDKSQQRFVAYNIYSIAQSKFNPSWVLLGIYHQETMVGFLMYGTSEEDPPGEYWVIRLMIDIEFQGKGYGKTAMQTLIKQVKTKPDMTAILTSYVSDNTVAAKLYASLGFVETGEVEEGEVVVKLQGH